MEFVEKLAKLDCTLGHACQFCPQEATCSLDKPHHNRRLIEARLEEIDQIIVVLANKGGVGKSTVAANLATGLALRGFRVGMADADIHGPNQSRFFGFAGSHTRTTFSGLNTLNYSADGIDHPLRVGSLAFLLADDTTPIVWRDAYKHDFIHHLIGSFDWGSLDYLVVDMPPGTGNEIITLCDMLEGSNLSSVLVTTPQAVAQMDTLKAGRFCRERGLPIVGAVENMSGVICPHCDGAFHIFPDAGLEEALAAFDIPRIARIPLSPELASSSDSGAPIVVSAASSAVARSFGPLVEAVAALGSDNFSGSVARTLSDVFAQNMAANDLQEALSAIPEEERALLEEEFGSVLEGEARRLQQAAREG